MKNIFVVSILIVILLACKKDKYKLEYYAEPGYAPCIDVLNENVDPILENYQFTSSLITLNNIYIPHSTYGVLFNKQTSPYQNSYLAFGFNGEPTSGIYILKQKLSNVSKKEIVCKAEILTMPLSSRDYGDSVYVYSTENEIVISFCKIRMRRDDTSADITYFLKGKYRVAK